jgi:hypothetical protein
MRLGIVMSFMVSECCRRKGEDEEEEEGSLPPGRSMITLDMETMVLVCIAVSFSFWQ